jgi:hypothetical protein
MSEDVQIVSIELKNKLEKDILKDTLADAVTPASVTLKRIFDIGLSLVGSHVATRCPRLYNNLTRWNDEEENNDSARPV